MVAELVAGRLHMQSRPAMPHGNAVTVLAMQIGGPFRLGQGGPGGWWILVEPELHFSQDVMVPDLAGWRRTTLPAMPDVVGMTVVPDWICEVLSPSTRKFDLTEKRGRYAAMGVGHFWTIDLAERILEVSMLRDGAWMLLDTLSDDDDVRCAPFDAVSFPLSALWTD